jgi:hypothetical protein
MVPIINLDRITITDRSMRTNKIDERSPHKVVSS